MSNSDYQVFEEMFAAMPEKEIVMPPSISTKMMLQGADGFFGNTRKNGKTAIGKDSDTKKEKLFLTSLFTLGITLIIISQCI